MDKTEDTRAWRAARARVAPHAIVAMLALGVWGGCATTAGLAASKEAAVPREDLMKKVGVVLAYIEGGAPDLPADLFPVAPLEDDKDQRGEDWRQTASAMRADRPSVAALKLTGVVGEDNRGYLALRHEESFANAAEKNAAQKSMSDENDRRKALYRGIARTSEERGLTLTRVERAFAAQRLARSAPGTLVQLPSNDDEYDLLLASPIAARLGASARPGAWVELP